MERDPLLRWPLPLRGRDFSLAGMARVPRAAQPRVLLTGATGLLGRQVLRVFEEHGWDVRGLGLARAGGRIVQCDLLNSHELTAQFDDFRPAIVIHCAAERRPEALEENRAYATKLNVDLTRDIGKMCKARGVWLIYISTNYVFDGKFAPYAEDAAPRPVNIYGESKYAGEQVLAEVHPEAATVRVPLLYGPIEYIGETSVTALLGAITKQQAPKLDNWQERFPTSTEDVALVLEEFASRYMARGTADPQTFGGIFHWQANEMQTKYTMATTIAEIAGLDSSGFIRVDDAPASGLAPRPQFERMLCSRMERVLEGDPGRFRSVFKESLREHLRPFLRSHWAWPLRPAVLAAVLRGLALCIIAVGTLLTLGRWRVRDSATDFVSSGALLCLLMVTTSLAVLAFRDAVVNCPPSAGGRAGCSSPSAEGALTPMAGFCGSPTAALKGI